MIASGVSPDKCMQTTAARAINELYREHLFQLALTFHGGMRAISYEWGSPNAKKDYSPDDGILLPMGQAMKKYASDSFYPKPDAMNPQVYPVKGGMEDWAYASSWDKTPGWVRACKPTTFLSQGGQYPLSKTIYTSDMLRTLNLLIETNSQKTPTEWLLGSVHQVLKPKDAKGNSDGDIPRNIRLQLMMIDLVQPYVRWSDDIQNDYLYLQKFWDNEIIAKAKREGRVNHPYTENDHVFLKWEVGGALTVDDTALYYITMTPPRSHSDLDDLDCSEGTSTKLFFNKVWLYNFYFLEWLKRIVIFLFFEVCNCYNHSFLSLSKHSIY